MAQSNLVVGTGAKALKVAVIRVDNDWSTVVSGGSRAAQASWMKTA